ncbi:putative FMRFamide receptor [Daphnia magna]|uniref:Putative FMRFamide receptor n=1 Tax=Daphnia magna TaxID=35525 RepID=A0A164QUK4_9CRUS|nr:putative FMRFamide receptor [Daphnia magna]
MDETMATSRDASFLQLHNNSREENGILTSASDSTEMAGFYQSFPHCVLPNVSVSNISESEKLYFPLFEFVISLVLLVVVALPGLVGNFISIFILSRPQMRTSLNVILIGLASFDSILLLTSILLFVVPSIYTYSGVGEFYYRHIHPLITPYTFVLGTTAQTSSVYLTLTVTVERYIAVCHPLRARAWCTCKRGRMAVIIIGIGSLLYNLPRFFEVERCLYLDNELGESWIILIPSNLRNDKTYITGYIVALYFLIMNFVPFTSLAILNGAIYKQVRKANRERSLLTNSQKREIGLATMLLCVVAVFFIFNILAMVVNIFEVANILVDEMTRVSNLLVSVNSSVNFVIYCIFGDKFQRLFLRYFCYCYCCCRRRHPQSGRSSPDNPDNSVSMGTNPGDVHRVSTFSTRSNVTPGRLLSISRLPVHTVRSNGNINGYICSANRGSGISSISTASRSTSDCTGQLYRSANRHQSSTPRPSIQYDRNTYNRAKLSNA